MSTSLSNEAPSVIGYTDRLLRPFLVAAYVAVTAVQLALSHEPAVGVGWALFVPVGLLALWTLAPTAVTTRVWQVGLLGVFALLSGILLAVPAGTSSAGFVFLASLAAGQFLASRRAAVGVAVIAAVSCALSSLVVDQMSPEAWPWWLGLTAGLPVYVGIARRERATALAVAQHAAAESERARASEAREAALLERGRIAREIHDVLGHSLSAISIQLDMADTLQANGRPDESMTAVRRARALAKSGIGETRRAVHALQEDSKPLTETIEGIAGSYGAAFTVIGTPSALRVETAQTLIRAAQEALTNAHRHAPGAALRVALVFDDAAVELSIENTGAPGVLRRIDDDTEGTGMGLQGMRERAELLGGTIAVGPTASPLDSDDGAGWLVTMRLPR